MMKLEFNNGHSTKWLFWSTISRSNLNLECWYFWREEIWRKTLRARMRTNNKLNPQVTQRSGIKPRPQWWEASTLSAAVLSLQVILVVHYTCYFFWKHILRQSTSFLGMQTEVAIYFCSRKQNLVKRNSSEKFSKVSANIGHVRFSMVNSKHQSVGVCWLKCSLKLDMENRLSKKPSEKWSSKCTEWESSWWKLTDFYPL